MLCNICFDDFENDDFRIITDCNHSFHKNCLIKIIYPKCPCCKADIRNLLNNNGISDKIINKNIHAEEFRIIVSTQNLDNFDIMQIFDICVSSKKLNGTKWKNIYKNILLPFIFNSYQSFQNYSIEMFNSNKPGIYLYYCDLDNIILNLIYGYKSSIIQWYEQNIFCDNPDFECFSKGVFNKVKKNYSNSFGVLFVINDIFDKKKYIFNHIFNQNNIVTNYPSNKNIIKSICEMEPIRLDENDRYNPEKITIELLYIYYLNNKNNILSYNFKYNSFSDFIITDINNYFKTNDKNKNKNGFLHFKFFNDNDINNSNEFYYFIENKKTIKYNDLVNSSVLTIHNLNDILMNYISIKKNSIVRLIIGDNEFTKICAFNVKFYNNECYFRKLEHPIIEQLFNINLSTIEKYKKFIDFKYVFI